MLIKKTKICANLLFLAAFFVLPFNLGKHFVFGFSYVHGLLSDYLIPTIYIQDTLIIAFLVLQIYLFVANKSQNQPYAKEPHDFVNNSSKRFFVTPGIFLLMLFLLFYTVSSLHSTNIYISLVYLLRNFIYALFCFYLIYGFNFESQWRSVIRALAWTTLLVSIIAIAQFYLQASLFNNYLFFGEQPYGFSTYGIAKENILGRTFIPSYGTFRHPNVLGGFLSVVTLWIIWSISKGYLSKKYIPVVSFSVLGLIFSLSLTAYAVFLVGLFVLFFEKLFGEKKYLYLLLISLFVLFSVFSIDMGQNTTNKSFYHRFLLFDSYKSLIPEHLFLGVGSGTSVAFIPNNFSFLKELRHPQPVHNLFILMLVENGVFTLIVFLGLFFWLIFSDLHAFSPFRLNSESTSLKRGGIFKISLLQICFLGLFDHYFLTIHQATLLLWLTLGLFFSYNQRE